MLVLSNSVERNDQVDFSAQVQYCHSARRWHFSFRKDGCLSPRRGETEQVEKTNPYK